MENKQAWEISKELDLNKNLGKHVQSGLICGSLRRNKPEVHDIDWVIIPNPETSYGFGDETLDATIERIHEDEKNKPILGSKLKRFQFKGISIDIYIANEKTFECISLIRTGSAEHNVKLTKIARQKDLKLYANGSGLCKIKGGIYNNEPEEIIEVIETTEKGILMNLLGRYPEPKERN